MTQAINHVTFTSKYFQCNGKITNYNYPMKTKIRKAVLSPTHLIFGRAMLYLNVPSFRPFVLPIIVKIRDTDGLTLTG